MLPVAQLHVAFGALPPVEYRRNLFRIVRQRFLGTPLSTIGASKFGARFTPVGGPDMLYLAEDPLTAFTEYYQQALATIYQFDDPFMARFPITGMVVPQVVLTVGRVLDLTRREVRVALGTNLTELAAPWSTFPGVGLPATQFLGQEAFNSGLFEAIRYPSVRNLNGVCIVVFVTRLVAGGAAFIDLDDTLSGGPKQRIP
jgi:RES domain-containing protein